jgi:CRISPR/Cas system-associated exonuclease Cas4 (RecB family)
VDGAVGMTASVARVIACEAGHEPSVATPGDRRPKGSAQRVLISRGAASPTSFTRCLLLNTQHTEPQLSIGPPPAWTCGAAAHSRATPTLWLAQSPRLADFHLRPAAGIAQRRTDFIMNLTDLRSQPHTSVSAIKEFVLCARRFTLHYIERAQPAYRASALLLGTAWHETLGKWLNGMTNIDELGAHLRDGIDAGLGSNTVPVLFADERENKGTLIDTAIRMLDVFLARVPKPEMTIGVEVPFSLDLAHPVTGEVLPIPLVGAIDAIVLDRAKGAVWEFKTAWKRWSVDQLQFDIQPTAYGIAARREGYEGSDLKILVTTKTGKPDVQIERIVRCRRDEEDLVEIAFGVHQAVQAGVEYPNRGWQCRSCPYGGVCR